MPRVRVHMSKKASAGFGISNFNPSITRVRVHVSKKVSAFPISIPKATEIFIVNA